MKTILSCIYLLLSITSAILGMYLFAIVTPEMGVYYGIVAMLVMEAAAAILFLAAAELASEVNENV